MLCILAVPWWMSPNEFAAFTAGYHTNMNQMRIIRKTVDDAHYMVVIKFREQKDAETFYQDFNGKAFSSLEPEATCKLVFLASVELSMDSHGLSQPFFVPSKSTSSETMVVVEIPSCPVCLERLDDSVTGLITTVCNHNFHCSCIAQWKTEHSCPVCRFTHESLLPTNQSSTSANDPRAPACFSCGTNNSLWMCLICGHLGCGRYVKEHARAHFESTKHSFAIELATKRVWDYMGDRYVHRIVQTTKDSGLSSFTVSTTTTSQQGNSNNGTSSPTSTNIVGPILSSLRSSRDNMTSSGGLPITATDQEVNKVESVSLEFTYLLEQQRTHFEEMLRRQEKEKHGKVAMLEQEYAHLLEEKVRHEYRVKALEEDKKRWETRMTDLERKMKGITEETKFLKEINQAHELNQKNWQQKVEEVEKRKAEEAKDQKISELQEQIRDLMFFIESREKIEKNPDLVEGQIVTAVSTPAKKTTKKTTPKKKH